jgi:glycosyltransferase involved in cell wall biosynthesis
MEARTPGRLVCVGRFFPSKGQDVLIRALAIITHTHPAVSLELIGEGPEQQACQNLARTLGLEQRCHFLGAIQHDEVLRHMASAVATVVPSRSEAFGLVNIESMAVGTPVVASAVGGITEIVRDGQDGFLVPPDAPELLAERLSQMLAKPKLALVMGANARQRFLSLFEQQRAVAEQADWLENIMAQSAG